MRRIARQQLFAWLQLLRLPNVFTAVADVAMGYLVTHQGLQPLAPFALLVVASCLLYLSGMVLNDVFDADIDAREQPARPIPSGRISVRAATTVAWALWSSGMLLGWIASMMTRDLRPGIIATLLAACIVLYDRFVKGTLVAPLVMGACRALNVLLGMSLAPPAADFDTLSAMEVAGPYVQWGTRASWLIASGVGVYIVGVTVFSRTDARTSRRSQLIAGFAVLCSGIALLAIVPVLTNNRPPLMVVSNGWYLLWILLALITARRCVAAIIDPSPQRVQAAVRHCVHTIIVLDAAVCVGYAGPYWGFAVLALIFPTIGLTAWLRAT